MIVISIKGNFIRSALAEVVPPSFKVLKINETPLPKQFYQNVRSSNEPTSGLIKVISESINSLQSKNQGVLISLDKKLVEAQILKADSRQYEDNRSDYLTWYLNQRNGKMESEILHFYQELGDSELKNNTTNIFCSSINTAILESIKLSLSEVGCTPCWIEPNICSLSRVIMDKSKNKFVNCCGLIPEEWGFTMLSFQNGKLSAISKLLQMPKKWGLTSVMGDESFAKVCFNPLKGSMEHVEIEYIITGELSKNHQTLFSGNNSENKLVQVNPFDGIKFSGKKSSDFRNPRYYNDLLGLMLRGVGIA